MKNTQCPNAVGVGLGFFGGLTSAKNNCSQDSSCMGVYDQGCDGDSALYFCRVEYGYRNDNLFGNCVYDKKGEMYSFFWNISLIKQVVRLINNKKQIISRISLENCIWNEWEEWTSCSKSCSGGQRIRQRILQAPPSSSRCKKGWETGESFESEACNVLPCPGNPIFMSRTVNLF